MSLFYKPQIVTNGLVLNLDAADPASYRSTGTTWYDLSPRRNNATLTNGPTFTSAYAGSIVFDGNNDYVLVPFNSSLALSSIGTLSAWCYPFTLSQASYAGLISMTTGGNNNQQSYVMHWRKIDDTLNCYVASGGTYNIVSIPLPTIIDWYHFVFTWNGSFCKLYQNGVLRATTAQTVPAQQLNTQVDIGGNTFRAQGAGANSFNGRIPVVQIYNRALSATEVVQNFNATRGRFGLGPHYVGFMASKAYYAPPSFNAGRLRRQQLIGSGVY